MLAQDISFFIIHAFWASLLLTPSSHVIFAQVAAPSSPTTNQRSSLRQRLVQTRTKSYSHLATTTQSITKERGQARHLAVKIKYERPPAEQTTPLLVSPKRACSNQKPQFRFPTPPPPPIPPSSLPRIGHSLPLPTLPKSKSSVCQRPKGEETAAQSNAGKTPRSCNHRQSNLAVVLLLCTLSSTTVLRKHRQATPPIGPRPRLSNERFRQCRNSRLGQTTPLTRRALVNSTPPSPTTNPLLDIPQLPSHWLLPLDQA